MKTAHTPGPWNIGQVTPARFPAYPIKADALDIAEVPIMAHGRSLHDARLIAAAPDLLAACKLALVRMEDLAVAAPKQEAETDRHAATIRAAIAKATACDEQAPRRKQRGFVVPAVAWLVLAIAGAFAQSPNQSDAVNLASFVAFPNPISGAVLGVPIYCREHACKPASPEAQQ